MIIPTQLLRETEERYRERQEPREEWRQEIAAGGVVGANAPEVVQRRLERLSRVEATMGTPVGAFALERVIGKSDLIGVVYLELALAVSRSVGRVHIRTATGQTVGFGTGFMVSPRLLLTNNHVLSSAREASNSRVEFNFQEDLAGQPLGSSSPRPFSSPTPVWTTAWWPQRRAPSTAVLHLASSVGTA